MNLREKIAAINVRLKQIADELKEADAERIGELESESRTLVADREKLTRTLAEQTRQGFEGGEEVNGAPATNAADEAVSKMSKRDKIAFMIGKQARGISITAPEKRALGTALTTTSPTFSQASELINGVNNAGIFIPTSVVLDLLREDEKLSPILNDVAFTAVKGLVDFPYRKSRDKAKPKTEGAEGKDNQMEWAKLTGVKGYLQTVIAVTDEVKALTDFDFGAYIIDQIMQDINEDWTADLIYGSGTDDRIKGLTVGATAAAESGYAAGKTIETLVNAIKLCKGQYRRGAKIYVAQDVADEILFSVDDNGNFKYPVFNNSSGITSFGTIRIEVDENLKDGDFIIGNVGKYFKANSLIPIRIETDRVVKRGITEYVASEYCSTAPFPGAFIYGWKKST